MIKFLIDDKKFSLMTKIFFSRTKFSPGEKFSGDFPEIFPDFVKN